MLSSKYCELYWVCTVSFCETLTTGHWKVFLYRVGVNAHGRVVPSSVSFVYLLLQCLQVTVCAGPTVPTNCVQTVHRKTWTLVGTLTSSVRALTTHRLPVGAILQVWINAGQRDSEHLKGQRRSSRYSLPQGTWWLPGLSTPQMLQAQRLHYISIHNVLKRSAY